MEFDRISIKFGDIILDCKDAEALADFYVSLLGGEKKMMYGMPTIVKPGFPTMICCAEEDYLPPIWPEQDGMQQKQMHLDFQVSDLAGAVAYAEKLGAKKTEKQYDPDHWITMADPAGHPFCLCVED